MFYWIIPYSFLCPFLATSYHLNFVSDGWCSGHFSGWYGPHPHQRTPLGGFSSSSVGISPALLLHGAATIWLLHIYSRGSYRLYCEDDHTTAPFPSSLAAYRDQGIWVPLHRHYQSRRSRSHHYLLWAASQWSGRVPYRPFPRHRLPRPWVVF